MPSERDPLLSSIGELETRVSRHRRRCCPPTLSQRYKNTCVTTKGGLFVLLWMAAISCFWSTAVLFILHITLPSFVYFDLINVFFPLLCPVAALLGELRWTRFKSLMLGSILLVIGSILQISIVFSFRIISTSSDIAKYVSPFPFTIMSLGEALILSNAIQYGIEQLDFASSEVLSSFVVWYFWTGSLVEAVVQIALVVRVFPHLFLTTMSYKFFSVVDYVILSAAGLLFLVLMCTTLHCCCWNPELRMSQGHGVNPVKLIWRVMQFARKNKHPPLRSAFTYSEMPSRLDLAKQRYGGPFTTWEVEDVKSFWRIILLLAALIGFRLVDDTQYTSIIWVFFKTHSYYIPDCSTSTLSSLVIIVYVPLHQFVIRPHFFRYIPSMLTRMKLGLLIAFASLLITTAYSVLVSQVVATYVSVPSHSCEANHCIENGSHIVPSNFSLCLILQQNISQIVNVSDSNITGEIIVIAPPVALNVLWVVIPQVLNGLTQILVALTALEFILAQAPRTMQGFLIGVWYAMQIIHDGSQFIRNTGCVGFHWEYYAVKSFLVLLSTILFLGVARKYKYRQLDEDADVNIQRVIEDVFERNFDREEKFYQQQMRDAEVCLADD